MATAIDPHADAPLTLSSRLSRQLITKNGEKSKERFVYSDKQYESPGLKAIARVRFRSLATRRVATTRKREHTFRLRLVRIAASFNSQMANPTRLSKRAHKI